MSSVFKYCSPARHYFKMLDDYQVNCSHPKYLNDEYENAGRLIEPYKLFCTAVHWGKRQKEQFNNHAIASFTNAELANNGYFWEKYADNGRGFAIEFDKQILEDTIAQEYVMPFYLQDVKYIDGQYNLDDFENGFSIKGRHFSVRECIDAYNNGDPMPMDRLFEYLRLVKNRERWSGEAESRIVIGNNRRSRHLHWNEYGCFLDLPAGAIKSVVLGKKTCLLHKLRIKRIARKNNIPVFTFDEHAHRSSQN